MNFLNLRKVFPTLLETGQSIELRSSPGRGKSTFIEDTIPIMSGAGGKPWGFQTLFLATQTPPDLIGYQFKGDREFSDGNGGTKKVAVTEPTLPGWMLTREGKPVWEYERGILFLDEYGQGEADVKRASAELLLNKRLGPWELPRGWSVVAASNFSTDRSGVTKSFDFVINRRIELDITDDIKAWTDWADDNGVSTLGKAFANANPAVVFTEGVPSQQGPWCTPRSLVAADKLMQAFDSAGVAPDSDEVQELVRGQIGGGAASQFFAMLKLQREMPTFEKIIADPKGTKVPAKPDAMMLACYDLAHRVDEKTAAPVVEYIKRLPKEFAVTFASTACKRVPKLVVTPSFSKWCLENSSLMAAINQQA